MPTSSADLLELGVAEFVTLLNQSLEYAFPSISITGELANFRISKSRWVYFDLKDEAASIKCFGTVYQLPGPLEDGMLLKVQGQPRLHQQYGFSFNVARIAPAGEGSIRRTAELLQAQLAAEGLFEDARKRPLPEVPRHIGLITSGQSAAYADFLKVIAARWQGLQIDLIDVQVQGEVAPAQICQAVAQFNALTDPPEVLVLIRGGGSPEDLAAFSSEPVVRAVAASRVPTLVAIGHEVDICLAELAADLRASTPSNAAELLVPDRKHAMATLVYVTQQLHEQAQRRLQVAQRSLADDTALLATVMSQCVEAAKQRTGVQAQLLGVLNPRAILRRGYAIVRLSGQPVGSHRQLAADAIVEVQLGEGGFRATVNEIQPEKGR